MVETNYLCPHCKGYINVGENVIFSIKDENQNKGLIMLSKQIGNYSVKSNNRFKIAKGKKYEFFCPICNANLASDVDYHLAKILLADDQNNLNELLFSEIAGERCTYVLKHGKVEFYGEDSEHYVNYFGEIPKY